MRRTFKRGARDGCGRDVAWRRMRGKGGSGGARPPVLLPRRNWRDRGCADHRRAGRYLRGGEAGDVRFRFRVDILSISGLHMVMRSSGWRARCRPGCQAATSARSSAFVHRLRAGLALAPPSTRPDVFDRSATAGRWHSARISAGPHLPAGDGAGYSVDNWLLTDGDGRDATARQATPSAAALCGIARRAAPSGTVATSMRTGSAFSSQAIDRMTHGAELGMMPGSRQQPRGRRAGPTPIGVG